MSQRVTTGAQPQSPGVLPEEIRRIDLSDEDWRWNIRRPVQPAARPKGEPVDVASVVGALEKAYTENALSVEKPLRTMGSRFEPAAAHVLLRGLASIRHPLTPERVREIVASPLPTEDELIRLVASAVPIARRMSSMIWTLVHGEPEAFIRVVLGAQPARSSVHCSDIKDAVVGFRAQILPHLDDAAKERMRSVLRAPVLANVDPIAAADGGVLTLELLLAAAIGGMENEIAAVVTLWAPKENWQNISSGPVTRLAVLFGLGDPDRIAAEAIRLRARPASAEMIRALLATTEFRCLDLILEVIAEWGIKGRETLTNALACAHAPEVAPTMLRLTLGNKPVPAARRWLESHPRFAAEGLAPMLFARERRFADAATRLLRSLKGQGHEDAIERATRSLPMREAEALRTGVLQCEERNHPELTDEETPDWLRSLAEAGEALAEPNLPPLVVMASGQLRQLTAVQTASVIAALERSPLGEQPDLMLAAVKAHVVPSSRDAFAWKLFEGWIESGATERTNWRMAALGHIGTDASTNKLAMLIRRWPREYLHARAALGLECLAAMRTDCAIQALSYISQMHPLLAVNLRASTYLEEIALERGLSLEQLEDQVIPNCGLDATGKRTAYLESRRFALSLDGGLQPVLLDEATGLRRLNLPRPSRRMDAAAAAVTVAEWRQQKINISEMVAIQSRRLARAMFVCRTWTPIEFNRLLVNHPLMSYLVRHLVWYAVGIGGGEHLLRFRVAEDRTYADITDSLATLPESALCIGIVRPDQFADDQRAAWGAIFADYGIVPALHQLDRSTNPRPSVQNSQ